VLRRGSSAVPGDNDHCGLNSSEQTVGQEKVAARGASRGACEDGDRLDQLVQGRRGGALCGRSNGGRWRNREQTTTDCEHARKTMGFLNDTKTIR
jgi:hypothetical protein